VVPALTSLRASFLSLPYFCQTRREFQKPSASPLPLPLRGFPSPHPIEYREKLDTAKTRTNDPRYLSVFHMQVFFFFSCLPPTGRLGGRILAAHLSLRRFFPWVPRGRKTFFERFFLFFFCASSSKRRRSSLFPHATAFLRLVIHFLIILDDARLSNDI